jgi:uncharacterized protein YuzE
MGKAKIVFNKEGNTLDIWFGNPKKEAISEETSEEMILKKDRKGRIIGVEILNFIRAKKVPRELPVQLAVQ